jgi:hypothetical protein
MKPFGLLRITGLAQHGEGAGALEQGLERLGRPGPVEGAVVQVGQGEAGFQPDGTQDHAAGATA